MSLADNTYLTAFETDNARNLTAQQLSSHFIWLPSFERLLTPKNHIVLGSRGSGKTAFAKMLSHSYLARSSHAKAKRIIEDKSYIGTYVPMKLDWIGGISNKSWMTDEEKLFFFQWRLNIATCMAFTSTIESCLNEYVGSDGGERSVKEYQIVCKLAKEWFDECDDIVTIKELREALEDIEFKKQKQIIRYRILGESIPEEMLIGLTFEMDLFTPFKRAVTLAKRFFNVPDESTWLLCLDEAEFLDKSYHKALNSHLRTESGNIAFKITTLPYHHHTLDTLTEASLDIDHDFQYVYIDQMVSVGASTDPTKLANFSRELFTRRLPIALRKSQVSLDFLLGSSELLGDVDAEWAEGSPMMKLLEKYATAKTIDRAKEKINDPGFKDQIGRKMQGMLLLKDAVGKNKGNTDIDIYSGVNLFVLCSDGNPRRIIRMLNSIVHAVSFKRNSKDDTGFIPLKKSKQSSILKNISQNALLVAQVEPEIGNDLYEFLKEIGEHFSDKLHSEKVGSDYYGSISVTSQDPEIWKYITRSVALGLMVPNINTNNPDPLPRVEGVFRLAYVLSPMFNIMPRKGKSIKLNSVYMKQKGLIND